MFNEKSLRADIVATWGPAGAHIDVYDTLVSQHATNTDRMNSLLAEVIYLRAEVQRLEQRLAQTNQ